MRSKVFFLGVLYTTFSVGADMSLDAIDQRTQPVGQVNIEEVTPVVTPSPSAAPPQAVATTTTPKDTGKKIYESTCVVCHASGAAGAPIFGNAAAWKPRIKQGESVLVAHVLSGYKLMPAKGTCVQCSENDIKAAVEYMIKQVH